MSKKAEEKQLSYSGWVRQQMLLTQNLTLGQLQEAHDKSHWDKSNRPKDDSNILRQQSGILRKRWVINSLDEIPYKSDGSLNLSGMIRLYLKENPNSDCASCIKHFALDGLQVSNALFIVTRQAMRKKESPDDNQHNGPRAGKEEPVRKERKKKSVLSDNAYFQMLVDAKKLVDKIGGIGPARKVLDILETIRS